jgi:ribose transport system permease protein
MSNPEQVQESADLAVEPAIMVEARRPRAMKVAPYVLPIMLVVFVVFFSLAKPETYFTTTNLTTVLSTQSVLGILTIALILPLVVGEFDLSVGAVLGLGVVLVTGLASKSGLAFLPAVVVTLLICAAVGIINGLLVAKVGVNSLIVTLGMSTIVSGGVLWYTDGNTITENIPPALISIAQDRVLGIPLPGVYLFAIALVVWYVLECTPIGRYMHAVGGSKEASRLSGLNTTRLTLGAFTASAVLAGLAGILQAGLLGSGSPTVGPPLLFAAFAGAFLGATAIKVGTFNVWGTIIGVFTLAAGVTGLQQLGAPFFVGPVFQGVALILAVVAVRIVGRTSI